MYCSTCGSEVQEGLRYCNRCGANLAAETGAPPRLFGIIMVLAAAVVLVGVSGLVAIFFFAIEFMSRGNIPAESLAFLVIFTLVVFAIDVLLIRQLSNALGVYLKSGSATTETPKLNKTPSAAQLPEQKQTAAQVLSPHQTASPNSEQTTRVLQDFQDEESATRRLDENE
jgi:predicted nucleic acid-binding Zn ribbon protein